jgi:hypothetical protein
MRRILAAHGALCDLRIRLSGIGLSGISKFNGTEEIEAEERCIGLSTVPRQP